MSTIKRTDVPLFCSILITVFIIAAQLLGSESAPADEAESRFRLSLTASVFRPTQEAFRQLYGNLHIPVAIQLDSRLPGNLSVFTGFRHVAANGKTKVVGPQFVEETYPLRFAMSSVRLGLYYNLYGMRSSAFLGGGVSYNVYREKWEEGGFEVRDKIFGFLAQAGGGYSLSRRLALIGKMEFSSVQTRKGSKLEPGVNLGGLELSLGFSLNF